MVFQLDNLNDKLFGRDKDIEFLKNRALRSGLTAIVARPQMGKSWLLRQVAYELGAEETYICSVGFAESYGQTIDLFLRAISDLYKRMLLRTSFVGQAKIVWERQKDRLVEGFSKLAGSLAKGAIPVYGTLVENLLNGIVSVNKDLISGGLQLPLLAYEQAKDLIGAVALVDSRPIVLFLDQWEQSSNLTADVHLFRSILANERDWPNFHIFLGVRAVDGMPKHLVELERGYPKAKLYNLPPMDLNSEAEKDRLFIFLGNNIKGIDGIDRNDLLKLIDGNPGVVSRWISSDHTSESIDFEVLSKIANNAHSYRFDEVKEKLLGLSQDCIRLIARLAFMSIVSSREAWPFFKEIIFTDIDETKLDELKIWFVLEEIDPPSFGHELRWEEFRKQMIDNRLMVTRQEVQNIVTKISSKITNTTNPTGRILCYFSALLSFVSFDEKIFSNNLIKSFCFIPLAMSKELRASSVQHNHICELLLSAAKECLDSKVDSGLSMLTMGFANVLGMITSEDNRIYRAAMLKELRALAMAWPENEDLQENLARGLYNALISAEKEGDKSFCVALLQELRDLARRRPEDEAVRGVFAGGINNILLDYIEAGNILKRDQLFDELRALASDSPKDEVVRQWLAGGLVNMLNSAKAEDDLSFWGVLFQELRDLAANWPEDKAVREKWAIALFNALIDAKAEDGLPWRDDLLRELHDLATSYPEDGAVREKLAMGLLNILVDVSTEHDPVRRFALLDELRSMVRQQPEDASVRYQLAKGLAFIIDFITPRDNFSHRNTLLNEFRELAAKWPEDCVLWELWASVLVNTLSFLTLENNLLQRDNLFEELETIAEDRNKDKAVQKWLARGFFVMFEAVDKEGDRSRRAQLLSTLRSLSATWPEDDDVQEVLAMGLINTLAETITDKNRIRGDALLEELRGLAAARPGNAVLRGWLARGLYNMLSAAQAEGNSQLCHTLLNELENLANEMSEDDFTGEPLARGLFLMLKAAVMKNDQAGCSSFIISLRELYVKCPECDAVKEPFIKGLFLMLQAAEAKGDQLECDTLLEELHTMGCLVVKPDVVPD